MRTGWQVALRCFAFNFLPVLASKQPAMRGLRSLIHDVLRLRNLVEDLLDQRAWGDCTVVLASRV
jgi:hypothetical protein